MSSPLVYQDVQLTFSTTDYTVEEIAGAKLVKLTNYTGDIRLEPASAQEQPEASKTGRRGSIFAGIKARRASSVPAGAATAASDERVKVLEEAKAKAEEALAAKESELQTVLANAATERQRYVQERNRHMTRFHENEQEKQSSKRASMIAKDMGAEGGSREAKLEKAVKLLQSRLKQTEDKMLKMEAELERYAELEQQQESEPREAKVTFQPKESEAVKEDPRKAPTHELPPELQALVVSEQLEKQELERRIRDMSAALTRAETDRENLEETKHMLETKVRQFEVEAKERKAKEAKEARQRKRDAENAEKEGAVAKEETSVLDDLETAIKGVFS